MSSATSIISSTRRVGSRCALGSLHTKRTAVRRMRFVDFNGLWVFKNPITVEGYFKVCRCIHLPTPLRLWVFRTLSARCRSRVPSRNLLERCFVVARVSLTFLPEAQRSEKTFDLQLCQKESHDCATKKRSCSTRSTPKRKPPCSLKTSSQQALFPHAKLEHPRIPPKIHFGLPLLHLAAPPEGTHPLLAPPRVTARFTIVPLPTTALLGKFGSTMCRWMRS